MISDPNQGGALMEAPPLSPDDRERPTDRRADSEGPEGSYNATQTELPPLGGPGDESLGQSEFETAVSDPGSVTPRLRNAVAFNNRILYNEDFYNLPDRGFSDRLSYTLNSDDTTAYWLARGICSNSLDPRFTSFLAGAGSPTVDGRDGADFDAWSRLPSARANYVLVVAPPRSGQAYDETYVPEHVLDRWARFAETILLPLDDALRFSRERFDAYRALYAEGVDRVSLYRLRDVPREFWPALRQISTRGFSHVTFIGNATRLPNPSGFHIQPDNVQVTTGWISKRLTIVFTHGKSPGNFVRVMAQHEWDISERPFVFNCRQYTVAVLYLLDPLVIRSNSRAAETVSAPPLVANSTTFF